MRASSIAQADVLVENFRPGVMARLGLGYEQLRARATRARLLLDHGVRHGAGAELPGYDLLVQALGGPDEHHGPADGEPQKVGVALVDVICGLFAAIGILAALRYRDRTGEGQRVELDLLSCLLAALVNQGSAYTLAGEVAGRMGSAHPSVAPYELMRAGEEELVLAVGTDAQFRSLCCDPRGSAAGRSGALRAPTPRRVANRAELKQLLQERLAARPAARLGGRADGRGRARGRRERHRRRVRARRSAGPGPDRRAGARRRGCRTSHAQPDRSLALAGELSQRPPTLPAEGAAD